MVLLQRSEPPQAHKANQVSIMFRMPRPCKSDICRRTSSFRILVNPENMGLMITDTLCRVENCGCTKIWDRLSQSKSKWPLLSKVRILISIRLKVVGMASKIKEMGGLFWMKWPPLNLGLILSIAASYKMAPRTLRESEFEYAKRRLHNVQQVSNTGHIRRCDVAQFKFYKWGELRVAE